MNYSFHLDAEKEFSEAIDYYESRQVDLGFDFSAEVYASIQRIVANPEAWTEVDKRIRRALTNRYPYGILYHYSKNKQLILILAVMHLHREPDYWKYRKD